MIMVGEDLNQLYDIHHNNDEAIIHVENTRKSNQCQRNEMMRHHIKMEGIKESLKANATTITIIKLISWILTTW
jgi:metal-sulfur cluster biosynthetic enzyme